MPPKKKKLNLTVAPEKRRRAKTLAELDNRSLSSLFETLVDEAWEQRNKPTPPAPRATDEPSASPPPKTKPVTYRKKK